MQNAKQNKEYAKCNRNLKRQNNIKQTIKNTIQDIKNRKKIKNDQKEIKSNKQVAAVSYWSLKADFEVLFAGMKRDIYYLYTWCRRGYLGIGDTMLWMVLLGGRIRSEEDVVGDPRIRNSSHSAAHLS